MATAMELGAKPGDILRAKDGLAYGITAINPSGYMDAALIHRMSRGRLLWVGPTGVHDYSDDDAWDARIAFDPEGLEEYRREERERRAKLEK